MSIRVYGVPFSAHTRKVLVALRDKQLDFELSPLVPLAPDLPREFLAASPLRKIPVLVHDGVAVTDSTVIALYLDRVYPERPLYPRDAARYATALFVEELVDGSLAPSVLHGILLQRVFGPAFVAGFRADAAVVQTALANVAARLADLEARLEGDWFAGEPSYADTAVCSILMNLRYAGERLDAREHPRLAAHFGRCVSRPSIAAGLESELRAASDVPGLDLTWIRETLGR